MRRFSANQLLLVAFLGSGCLTVVSDQAPPPASTTGGVSITGGPQVSCTPVVDSFPPTADGTTTTVPIYCSNIGSAASGINLTIEIAGTASDVFTASFPAVGGFPTGGLSPNQSIEITTTYSPTVISKDQSALTLVTNAGTLKIPMFGEGINSTCELKIPTEAIDFGTVMVGQTAQPVMFTILNIGNSFCEIQGPLSIQNDPSNSFQVVSTNIEADPGTGAYLIPDGESGVGSSLVVTVNFAPTKTGQLSGQVGDFVALTGSGQASP